MEFVTRYSLKNDTVTLELNGVYGDQAKRLLAGLNGYVRVQLSRPARPRTVGYNSQNHHINGHVQQIAHETGNEFEHVKHAAKQLALKRGYPFRLLAGQVVPYSETELDVSQAAMLIEALHEIAADMGLTLRE